MALERCFHPFLVSSAAGAQASCCSQTVSTEASLKDKTVISRSLISKDRETDSFNQREPGDAGRSSDRAGGGDGSQEARRLIHEMKVRAGRLHAHRELKPGRASEQWPVALTPPGLCLCLSLLK